jgi:hypothetical protein
MNNPIKKRGYLVNWTHQRSVACMVNTYKIVGQKLVVLGPALRLATVSRTKGVHEA